MAQNNNQESLKRKEPKRKFALWVRESTLDRVKELYQEDNCKSQSEFIEKAVLFYTGYLISERNKSYLSPIITSTLKSIVAEFHWNACVENASKK